MSASPEPEAKPTLPADPVAEDGGQPEQDTRAATPIAGDNDDDDNEGAELKAQVDGADDDEDDDALPKPAPAADDDNGDEEEANGGGSDDESILSEVDEAQFEDFDPENVDIEDRPQLAIDEDNLKLIGRHKRKRTEEGDGERSSRRKKEGRREKKSRRMRELEEGGEDDEGEGKSRKKERKKRDATPDEELLDPETRMSFFPSNIKMASNKHCRSSSGP
jgi:transcription factor SPN1